MARKKKEEFDMEEFNRKCLEQLEEYNKQFIEEHLFKVYTFGGRTYITCKTRDYITRNCEVSLSKLLQLMDIEYVHHNIPDDYGLAIDGDDSDRAAFIQKFIDDGYKLKWK